MTMILDIDDIDSCRADNSLSSNKYSIILTYCFTVTEYKYKPYKWNSILPDSRKTVVYDTTSFYVMRWCGSTS